MFFEWWMIAILIAASIGWGEYRYGNGIQEAVEGVERRVIQAQMIGGYNAIQRLWQKGLIKLDGDGNMTGVDGVTWNPNNDPEMQRISDRVSQKLNGDGTND